MVKPIRSLSLYASYARGLEYGAVAHLAAANRNDVTPAIGSRTYEAGVKLDLGQLGLTAAVFDITRQSPIRDPITNIFALNGEEEHKGFEA